MKKENLFKFYQTYKLYIFPIAVVLASLILIFLIILPQTIQLIKAGQTEKEFSTKSKFLEAKGSELENYDEEDLTKKVNYALSALPAEKDFTNIISTIQGLTTQLGFNIISFGLNQSGGDKSTNSQSFGAKVELSGSKALLLTLLNSIENSPRIMRINSLDVTGGGNKDSVNVNLEIAVLFASAPKEFGSVDSPIPTLTEKDEQVLVRLSQSYTSVPSSVVTTTTTLSPTGKANPFE